MSHSTAHAAHHPALQHHFDTLEQQQNASMLGMWMFLVTEVLFFGGFFMAYILYRWMYNASFHEASHELNVWLGLFNTAVLIGSSLTMALAVRASKTGEQVAAGDVPDPDAACSGASSSASRWWSTPRSSPITSCRARTSSSTTPTLKNGAEIYFSLYFGMTGLHATHMILGGFVLVPLIVMAARGKFAPAWYTPIELFGLYWHFVDIVWIFLFPLLYLM